MALTTDEVSVSARFISQKIGDRKPSIGIILGSGLGEIADHLIGSVGISYSAIPGFSPTSVEGHQGSLVFGRLASREVVVMKGRHHYYEGIAMDQLVFPVRVLDKLGIKTMIITSATGGVNSTFAEGDIVVLTDHINFTFCNPLIGAADRDPFLDATGLYDPKLLDLAFRAGTKSKIKLRKGVYFYFTGPAYETPAEVRMAETLGADVVGMSTFPEALQAYRCGIKVLGISYVANLAAGLSDMPLSHSAVMNSLQTIKQDVVQLITAIVYELE